MTDYTHSDMIQALVAALMFHEDIALAARDEKGGQLHPGAGNTVFVSEPAADLIREAWAIVEGSEYGDALREDKGHGYAWYDLRKAI